MPKPGAPGSETWKGKDIEHGGAPTWFTGSYDPQLDLVYWPTGNPSKEYNGDDRQGDNLYASCILALDRKTGALRWHYQFTPHDLWDWDATQTSVLVDADWQGQPRKLMLHADRNGFFYVFDRAVGRAAARDAVREEPDLGQRHRRRRPADASCRTRSRRLQGTKVCPSQDGATNWYLPVLQSRDRASTTSQTFEKCSIYTKSAQGAVEERRDLSRRIAAHCARPQAAAHPRAIDIRTGAWCGSCRSAGRATRGAAR